FYRTRMDGAETEVLPAAIVAAVAGVEDGDDLRIRRHVRDRQVGVAVHQRYGGRLDSRPGHLRVHRAGRRGHGRAGEANVHGGRRGAGPLRAAENRGRADAGERGRLRALRQEVRVALVVQADGVGADVGQVGGERLGRISRREGDAPDLAAVGGD